jgi:hypothetical protein
VAVHIRGLAVCLSTAAAVLTGCGECSDCEQGPVPAAYVRVQTATSTGPMSGVAVRFERQAFVPLTAATGALGDYTFEALQAVDGETATVVIEPPAAYTTPAPQVLSLILNDTVHVQILLNAAP